MQDELGPLLTRAAYGDREAFASFYDRTAPTTWRLVRISTPEPGAEDLMTRTYLRAWSEAPAYPAAGRSPLAWLSSLVHDAARSPDRGEGQVADLAGLDFGRPRA